MNQILVNPLKSSPREISASIKQNFNLKSYPFENIDDDLIFLAFSPSCAASKNIKEKYGTCDHQSLEFLGDRFLYGVVADLLYEYFGLGATPKLYTQTMERLTNNRAITDAMLINGSCKYVRSTFTIRDEKNFHNPCGDSFEALIGALYIHLKKNYPKLNFIDEIKKWLINDTYFPYIIKNVVSSSDDLKVRDMNIFISINKEDIQNGIDEEIKFLEDGDIEDEQITEIKLEIYNDSLYEIPEKSLIISDDEELDKIYSALGWKYEEPTKTGDLYLQYGDGIVYGVGHTPLKTMYDTLEELYLRGYISPIRYAGITFSKKEHRKRTDINPPTKNSYYKKQSMNKKK